MKRADRNFFQRHLPCCIFKFVRSIFLFLWLDVIAVTEKAWNAASSDFQVSHWLQRELWRGPSIVEILKLWISVLILIFLWQKWGMLIVKKKKKKKWDPGTSLVVQWLRIYLPMQRTQVRALVQEDPTCHGATKPVCHNYWACALEPVSHNYWAHEPQLLKPACLEPVLCNEKPLQWESHATATKSSPRSPQPEKARVQQQRPNTAKSNK